MSVQYLKLISGEDVVADVIEKTDTHYKLKNPVGFMATPQGVGMGPISPLMELSRETVVKIDHVIFTGTPQNEILNAYNSQFGSGLVIPQSSADIKLKLT